ncbi:hypothetical protein GCM10008934_02560 [Virgibacillus salarius]|uniref:hypothetical protein n=1 Tax=Virgibacillus salarius TaxID=447199 RepID=UPI0031E14DE7
MSLDYVEVMNNLHQVEFSETNKNLVDDYFHDTVKSSFITDHEVFYPKGIFTEKGLECFYFFTKTKIAKVSFSKTINTQIWQHSRILSYELRLTDRHALQLEIFLEDGQTLLFDNQKDTNHYREDTLKKKIEEIYKLLEQKQ